MPDFISPIIWINIHCSPTLEFLIKCVSSISIVKYDKSVVWCTLHQVVVHSRTSLHTIVQSSCIAVTVLYDALSILAVATPDTDQCSDLLLCSTMGPGWSVCEQCQAGWEDSCYYRR